MLEVLDRFDRLTSCGRRAEECREREKAAKRFEATDLALDDQAKEGFLRIRENTRHIRVIYFLSFIRNSSSACSMRCLICSSVGNCACTSFICTLS